MDFAETKGLRRFLFVLSFTLKLYSRLLCENNASCEEKYATPRKEKRRKGHGASRGYKPRTLLWGSLPGPTGMQLSSQDARRWRVNELSSPPHRFFSLTAEMVVTVNPLEQKNFFNIITPVKSHVSVRPLSPWRAKYDGDVLISTSVISKASQHTQSRKLRVRHDSAHR